jgi:hypothetical protein
MQGGSKLCFASRCGATPAAMGLARSPPWRTHTPGVLQQGMTLSALVFERLVQCQLGQVDDMCGLATVETRWAGTCGAVACTFAVQAKLVWRSALQAPCYFAFALLHLVPAGDWHACLAERISSSLRACF